MSSRALRSPPRDALDTDARFMAAAIELGRRGLGRVAPNPAVGALVVKDEIVVGRGATAPGGRPHAETLALQQAGHAAAGATLYVSLEPCSHHGRTPPCADAIIAAGIARVVSALDDPDPRVRGHGHARLRAAGINVTVGLLRDAALRANLGHILRVTVGRPMVTIKLAQTADGFAAASSGAARLIITGTAANDRVHMVRAMHDAVMIGSGTAIADDPALTVRLPGLEDRRPLRIVLDSHLTLPPTMRLAATARQHPTLVIAGEGASAAAATRLRTDGVEIAEVARNEAGHVEISAALALLGARGLTRILCEGGPRLAAALIAHGLADEVLLLRSTMPLGHDGIRALDEASETALGDVTRYQLRESGVLGADVFHCYQRLL